VPVLIDKNENRFPYEVLQDNGTHIVLDGTRIFAGAMSEYQIEGVPVVVDRRVTVLAFRNRFTQAEKVALEMAALDNPGAPIAQRQLAAAIRVNMKDTDAATFIDLEREDTRQGVINLEAAGLLAAGRALVILDADVQDIERPQGV
jgi:hypothetical protein